MHLVPDKIMYPIELRKAGNETSAMLRNALNQIRRNSYVQRSIPLAGKHVNTRLSGSHETHVRQHLTCSKSSYHPQLRHPGERRDPATSYENP